ncbi:uncharacterized protein LOC133806611 [Humulus lupulus]|uniref:uncharacterized protein LOC133806611 n=1 Tax=Humulus lupulus TaxID=3486 RepID=UPI002B40D87A|nr:uncharacterized protein LOC133806611 [Humulus lupulus]
MARPRTRNFSQRQDPPPPAPTTDSTTDRPVPRQAQPTGNNGRLSSSSNHFDPLTNLDRPAYEDFQSPYNLGTRNHPGMLIASPILTENNFQSWKCSVTISLGAKNKMDFVDGTLPKPPTTDPNHGSWLRCNNMVMSWILNSISKEIKDSVMYLKTAAAIWQEIIDLFSEGNGPRIFKLKQALAQLWQGDDSVSGYFARLKSIWDEIYEYQANRICNCEAAKNNLDLYNRDQVLQFLTGLNDCFHSIRGQTLLIEHFPSLAKVFFMVIHDEK